MTKRKSIRPAAAPEPRDEGTAVRSRASDAAPSGSYAPSSGASSESGGEPRLESERVAPSGNRRVVPPSAAERDRSLAAQVAQAQRLLARLPASDRRRRLLHAAIVRRDEILLAGFLAEFDGS